MGFQRLNQRNVRRAAEETGLPVVAALRADNYTWLVVTDDHRHFKVDRETWEVTPDDLHWTSCRERFTESVQTDAEQKA